MEERTQGKKEHRFILDKRHAGSITGVKDVIAFDVKEVELETEMGIMTIRGNELHVKRLTLEKGELDLEGSIDSISYSEASKHGGRSESVFARLFG